MSARLEIIVPAQTIAKADVPGRHLYGPALDFILLGGGSLILLSAIWLAFQDYGPDWSLLITLGIANLINHPHFAHSYQIFYRDFRAKLFDYPKELRVRYFVAGIVVPLILIAYFAGTIYAQSPFLLGFAVNAMFFSVGWHYAKQGYGMAMVDAVLKKAFFSDDEKKRLLHNAYATWIFSWLLVNYLVSNSASQYFGIKYLALPVPYLIVVAGGLLSLATTVRAAYAISRRQAAGKAIAWNGLIAYGVSLYVWLLFREPILLLWIPLFHSLQYLAVVWRFEANRAKATESAIRPSIRLWLFIAAGIGLGYLGFWAVPQALDANVPYSKEFFGGSLFLFMFWIFINIHHYFLDSVMWRKGNPDVQRHLFS